MKVSILGTTYKIETRKISQDELLLKNHWAGYCAEDSKLIVVADMTEKPYFEGMNNAEQDAYRKRTLRHEIVHAFLSERGLSENSSVPESGWAKHEEMIDWIAIQGEKIYKAWKEVIEPLSVELILSSILLISLAISEG